MDTRTGEVAGWEHFAERLPKEELRRFVVSIDPANLSQVRRAELIRVGTTTVSPRSRCPCGSGHRFKRCCMYRPNNAPPPSVPAQTGSAREAREGNDAR